MKQGLHDVLEIQSLVASVALAWEDEPEQERRARAVAEQLGPSRIDEVVGCFHQPSITPRDAPTALLPLGRWEWENRKACLAVFFHFQEKGIDPLLDIAFGTYDWIQAPAIQVLYRLASQGVQADRIAAEFEAGIPQLRYEAVLYSRGTLCEFAAISPIVRHALDKLIEDWAKEDSIDTLDLLEPLAVFTPEGALHHVPLLRRLMNSAGRGTRHPMLDGQVMSEEEMQQWLEWIAAGDAPEPERLDQHAIRAALILLQLLPNDHSVQLKLCAWAVAHPDAETRRAILSRLAPVLFRSTRTPRDGEGRFQPAGRKSYFTVRLGHEE